MRILNLLTDAYGGRGGIALYNRNVLRALAGHASRPSVVALPRVASGEIDETQIPIGVQFVRGAILSKLHFAAHFAHRLGPRYDLVVCSHVNLLPFARVAALRSRAKLVLFTYGKEAWTPGRALSNRLLSAVDGVISIRQQTVDRMRAWSNISGVASYILENAFDLEAYAPGPRRSDLVAKYRLGGRRVLLTLARLDEERHGVDEVLEVLPALLREDPDLLYLIAGSGREAARLRDKALSLGLSGHTVFTGEVPEVDKADYLRLGDVFVMPGSHAERFDTYPMRFSFLEAMACGLPVVATRPTDLVQYDVQLPHVYVDASDQAAIVAGIQVALIRARDKRVAPELRHFCFAGFQDRLWSILGQIMNDTAETG